MTSRSWVAPAVLLGTLGFAVAEVWVFVQAAHAIGWWTVVLLVATAALGSWLLQREGSRTWAALQTSLRTGEQPSRAMADAILVLIGGVLLILPGFISDVVGLLLLLPFTRPVARAGLLAVTPRWASRHGVTTMTSSGTTIIQGETVDDQEETGPDDDDPPTVISGEILP